RLQILHDVWSTHNRIEWHRADDAADNEMRAKVAHVVCTHDKLIAQLALYAGVHLVHHRVLQIVVDDVDATGAGARQHKSRERVCERRSRRRKHAVYRIEKKRRWDKEQIAGADLNRQRTSVEATLQCLNLQRDAIVVNAVARMNARAHVAGRVVEPDTR